MDKILHRVSIVIKGEKEVMRSRFRKYGITHIYGTAAFTGEPNCVEVCLNLGGMRDCTTDCCRFICQRNRQVPFSEGLRDYLLGHSFHDIYIHIRSHPELWTRKIGWFVNKISEALL